MSKKFIVVLASCLIIGLVIFSAGCTDDSNKNNNNNSTTPTTQNEDRNYPYQEYAGTWETSDDVGKMTVVINKDGTGVMEGTSKNGNYSKINFEITSGVTVKNVIMSTHIFTKTSEKTITDEDRYSKIGSLYLQDGKLHVKILDSEEDVLTKK